jgi:hypothetical protein
MRPFSETPTLNLLKEEGPTVTMILQSIVETAKTPD